MQNKKPNKLYGCQTPTWSWCGKYKETFGKIILKLLEDYGWDILTWEKNFINDALATDDYGEFLNMLVILILPRQNGKTLCVIIITLFYLIFYPTIKGIRRISGLYSAHNVKTNTDTFDKMCEFLDNPDEYPDLYKLTHWNPKNERDNGIGKANGKEKIECRWIENGINYRTQIGFNARSKSNGRGVSKNFIIIDEAQEFTSEQSAAMLPTGSASKVKPQVFYLATPHYPSCPGDILKPLRQRVKENKPNNIMLQEWATDTIGDIYDRKRWARLNPSLGYILKQEYIETVELFSMAEDEFARERLGYWASEEELLDLPIPKEDWFLCKTKNPQNDGITCIGVKFDLIGYHASVSACVKDEDNFYIELLDVFDCRNGMNSLVEYVSAIGKNAAQIIIDGRGTSYDLQQRLLQNSIPKSAIIVTKTNDITDACSMLASAVVAHEITHSSQEQLDDSAITCTRRIVGNKGAWGFQDSDKGWAFIVESAALAYFAARTTKRNPKRKGRIG